MCGIVFKHSFNKKPVNNDILNQYDKQSHRGQEGFGLFDGQFMNMVHESRENNILKWLVKKDSDFILFHHRRPTSTVNVAKAAHPFSTRKFFGDTEYILAHNGHISNSKTLFVKHAKLGIDYQSLLTDLTFNDSESLLWELALTLEGKQKVMESYGGIAFIAIKKVKGKIAEVIYGRNTNPLNIKRDMNSIEIASEGPGVSIKSQMLYRFDVNTHATTKTEFEIPTYKPIETSDKWNSAKEGTYPNSGFRRQTTLLSAGSTATSGVVASEYDSYDDYHNARYGVKAATAGAPPIPKTKEEVESKWQQLRARFGKDPNTISSAGMKSVGDILESKKGKDGKFFVTEVQHSAVKVNMDSINLKDYEPMPSEVQNCAMEYMIQNQGNFEEAYYALERDYADYSEECYGSETFQDVHQQLLFEKAMEFIEKDPEYKTSRSVSSMWAALWDQRKLAEV